MHTGTKQHDLWLLAAVSAPVLHFAGCGWLGAVLAAGVVVPLAYLPKKWEGLPKPLAWAEAVSFGAAAGMLLPCSAVYWPSDNDLAVPLILLTLAVLTAGESAPRIGAVLALCVGLMMAPLVAAGAAKAEPEWLEPTLAPWPAGLCAALLLLCLPGGRGSGAGIAAAGIAVTGALLMQGTLSGPVAGELPDAFYQTARTLGHWETIVAAAMTLSWYAMGALLIRSGESVMAGAGSRGRMGRIIAAGTALAFIILRGKPYHMGLAAAGGFLWVIVPFWNAKRKMKKDEKRC